ncbi:MAG TPA: hypothetical protein VN759_12375 [Pseudolysinimonas sp.]|nr:hypothetical protein [Pseudolysinimonas sp.]
MATDRIYSFNWADNSEFPTALRPVPIQLRHLVGLLDGDERWSFGLWKVPEGMRFLALDLDRYPEEFLQAAGSADAMVIELRRREADGDLHQYAVGRGEDEPGESVVTWASNDPARPHRLTVPSAEVFGADEAAEVYWHYYQQVGTVPEFYRLRPVTGCPSETGSASGRSSAW